MEKISFASMNAKLTHIVEHVETKPSSAWKSTVAAALEEVSRDFEKMNASIGAEKTFLTGNSRHHYESLVTSLTTLNTFINTGNRASRIASAIYNFFICFKLGSSANQSKTHLEKIQNSLKAYGAIAKDIQKTPQKSYDYGDDDDATLATVSSEERISEDFTQELEKQISLATKGKPPIPSLFKYLFEQKLQITMKNSVEKQFLDSNGSFGLVQSDDEVSSPYSLVLKEGKWHLETSGLFSLRNSESSIGREERPLYELSISIDENGNFTQKGTKKTDKNPYDTNPLKDSWEFSGNLSRVLSQSELTEAKAREDFDSGQLAKDLPRLCDFFIDGIKLHL